MEASKTISPSKSDATKKEHWTKTLYVDHSELYLPILESLRAKSGSEVEGIRKILGEFGVPPGGKILDVSCGIGRHSIPLAVQGFHVAGYDISSRFVDYAREAALKAGLNHKRIRFYQGDSRFLQDSPLANTERFNAIMSLFESHGYYGEEEDVRSFAQMRNLALPRGLLIVQSASRDCLLRKFHPFGIYRISKELELQETVKFDLETSIIHNRWRFYHVSPGEDLRLLLEVPLEARVYTLQELKEVLHAAGWTHLKSYGSLENLGPLTPDDFHMVLVCARD